MTDIVERLRGIAEDWFGVGDGIHEPINQGADEIERLRETVRSLRAALERKQRPEAETIDGVITWIKEDAERLAKTRAALGEKE